MTLSMNPPYELVDNAEANRYEFCIAGYLARSEYIRTKDKVFLTHTEVAPELEGRGIGAALTEAVLKDIESKGLMLIPLCPYVAGYLKRHPEWRKLVLKGVNVA